MADKEQLSRLKQRGVPAWNRWRGKAESIQINLRGANLIGVNLSKANLSKADLSAVNLSEANLGRADLSGAYLGGADLCFANLRQADLSEANLIGADLSEANLIGADLSKADLDLATLSKANLTKAVLAGANLSKADLSGANLTEADLSEANLSETNLSRADLSGANLTGCRIFGVSAWRLTLNEGTQQRNLVITEHGEPEITADDIEVAQFIYLLLHNEKIRSVIDTITSKVVLILGRFTEERKAVLDALRNEARKRNYLPVVFDFENSASRTTDETVTLLARMARFVIADLSDAKSVLQELRGVVPDLPSVPVQPLILASQDEPGMFDFFRRFPWVLTTYRYDTLEQLIASLDEHVIGRAEAKLLELRGPKPMAG